MCTKQFSNLLITVLKLGLIFHYVMSKSNKTLFFRTRMSCATSRSTTTSPTTRMRITHNNLGYQPLDIMDINLFINIAPPSYWCFCPCWKIISSLRFKIWRILKNSVLFRSRKCWCPRVIVWPFTSSCSRQVLFSRREVSTDYLYWLVMFFFTKHY